MWLPRAIRWSTATRSAVSSWADTWASSQRANRLTYAEIFIFRIANGRIVESWGVVDVLSQLRQLGASGGIPS
jgi:hypothetical protein